MHDLCGVMTATLRPCCLQDHLYCVQDANSVLHALQMLICCSVLADDHLLLQICSLCAGSKAAYWKHMTLNCLHQQSSKQTCA